MFSFFKSKNTDERKKADDDFMNPSEEVLKSLDAPEVKEEVKSKDTLKVEKPTAPSVAPQSTPSSPAEKNTASLQDKESMMHAPSEVGESFIDAVDEKVDIAETAITIEDEAEEKSTEQITEQVLENIKEERAGWLARLSNGLKRTGLSITGVFTGTKIDDALYEELEAALLMADAGTAATQYLLEDVKQRVKNTKATSPQAVRELLAESLAQLLHPLEAPLLIGEHTPTVIMVAGVNGAGKTTSIGKLTRHLADANQKVLLAAGDTFRAAAKEQLEIWADRNQVEIISQEGGDPASVSYDAIAAGKARQSDVVIIDTAGRLATQPNLMDELKKIRRVINKAMDTAPHEVLLVVDGNTGQNALAQVKAFDEAISLTGLIVTKLDGTAKGGVIAAIALWSQERQAAGQNALPIYFIGVGEQVEDLQKFDAAEFAQALMLG